MEDRLNIQQFGFTPKYSYYTKDNFSFYYYDDNEIWILKDGMKALFSGDISTEDELKVLLKQIRIIND